MDQPKKNTFGVIFIIFVLVALAVGTVIMVTNDKKEETKTEEKEKKNNDTKEEETTEEKTGEKTGEDTGENPGSEKNPDEGKNEEKTEQQQQSQQEKQKQTEKSKSESGFSTASNETKTNNSNIKISSAILDELKNIMNINGEFIVPGDFSYEFTKDGVINNYPTDDKGQIIYSYAYRLGLIERVSKKDNKNCTLDQGTCVVIKKKDYDRVKSKYGIGDFKDTFVTKIDGDNYIYENKEAMGTTNFYFTFAVNSAKSTNDGAVVSVTKNIYNFSTKRLVSKETREFVFKNNSKNILYLYSVTKK